MEIFLMTFIGLPSEEIKKRNIKTKSIQKTEK